MENLLSVLHDKAPAKADAVSKNRRAAPHGRLSVGIKLHILEHIPELGPLIAALQNVEIDLNPNGFRKNSAKWCMVLEPVGSATTAIELIKAMEQYTGIEFFNNPLIHLQVCNPIRLSARNCARLNIGFYLSSDTLRRYSPENLETTFTKDPFYPRAKRIVLFDANGSFDPNFAWWGGQAPYLVIEPKLPVSAGRSDILVGPGSQLDIRNINLIATLLAHAEHAGYWHKLGHRFINELEGLLAEHGLMHLLDAPWVRTDDDPQTGRNDLFFSALQELVAYAYGESARIKLPPSKPIERLWAKWRHIPARSTSHDLLVAMRSMLMSYQNELVQQSRGFEPKGRKS